MCNLTRILILCTSLVAPGSFAAEPSALTERHLNVDDPRPVAKAIHTLGALYGYSITYEDPVYVHELDIRDVTNEVRRDLHRFEPGKAPKVLGPRGGSVDLTCKVLSTSGEPEEPGALIEQILSTHQAQNQGAPTFRLIRSGGMFHVVPSRARNRGGLMQAQASILEERISIPMDDRSGLQMIEAVCSALTAARGVRVDVGLIPLNLFVHFKGRQGANNEIARDVILRMFESMDRKLAWSIYYGPGTQRYTFNVRVLDDPTTTDRKPDRRPLPPPPRARAGFRALN